MVLQSTEKRQIKEYMNYKLNPNKKLSDSVKRLVNRGADLLDEKRPFLGKPKASKPKASKPNASKPKASKLKASKPKASKSKLTQKQKEENRKKGIEKAKKTREANKQKREEKRKKNLESLEKGRKTQKVKRKNKKQLKKVQKRQNNWIKPIVEKLPQSNGIVHQFYRKVKVDLNQSEPMLKFLRFPLMHFPSNAKTYQIIIVLTYSDGSTVVRSSFNEKKGSQSYVMDGLKNERVPKGKIIEIEIYYRFH